MRRAGLAAPCYAPAVRKLPRNKTGRDFAAGDLHGCIDLLDEALAMADFEPGCDRLLLVGDLINRGPQSARMVELLQRQGVYSCRGNHEDMLLKWYAGGEPSEAFLRFAQARNGFGWWADTPKSVRAEVIAAARMLPIAIEVDTECGPVGIVHADVMPDQSWDEFIGNLERGDNDARYHATWSRERAGSEASPPVEGVFRVFTGHNPIAAPVIRGNLVAIDTGAAFGVAGDADSGALTLVDILADWSYIEVEAMRATPMNRIRIICDGTPVEEPADRGETEMPFSDEYPRP
jgi:serine/threonine protein phosphatase 1